MSMKDYGQKNYQNKLFVNDLFKFFQKLF